MGSAGACRRDLGAARSLVYLQDWCFWEIRLHDVSPAPSDICLPIQSCFCFFPPPRGVLLPLFWTLVD